nr:MAG TPA: hypothetical protein [Bacteriophage sp.]
MFPVFNSRKIKLLSTATYTSYNRMNVKFTDDKILLKI